MKRSKGCWSACAPTPAASRATWRRCGPSWTGRSRPGAEQAGLALENALVRALRTGRLGFEDLKRVALSAMAEIAVGLDPRRARRRFSAAAGGVGGSGLAALASLLAAFAGAPGKAIGGPVSPGAPIWSASAGRNCSCRRRAGGSSLSGVRAARDQAEHQCQRAGRGGAAGAEGVEPAGGAGGEAGAADASRIEAMATLAGARRQREAAGDGETLRRALLDGQFPAADDGERGDDRAGRASSRGGVLQSGRPGRADLGGRGPLGPSAARYETARDFRSASFASAGGRRG